jgi:hypothetical protein
MWAAALVGVFAIAGPQAQQRLQFDVAAIRENPRSEPGGFVRFMPDGGIRAEHMTPGGLVAVAYELESGRTSTPSLWCRCGQTALAMD